MLPTADAKALLRHTWAAFFARYGNVTPVQQQALLPILAGKNALLMAVTASGKTEAAVAPLLERHVFADGPIATLPPALRILYICPTRALVRDLYERLQAPLQMLGVTAMMKSGDTGPVSTTHPPTLLITTPESTDSLLTRAPRLLIPLRAIVLDEIHLFDNSPRGDQIRCLLRRIAAIQQYHRQQTTLDPFMPLQRVALSATVPDPAGIVSRYLDATDPAPGDEAVIVDVPGARHLQAEIYPMHELGDLVTALAWRAVNGTTRKSLLFCNTRNEVEQVAAYLRHHLPYEAAIFVHYSNLDAGLRRSVEEDFAAASVALCVSSATLELGIDIGSIDDVVLIGPPPTLASFLQRIGRGGRRHTSTHVLCLPRTLLEEVRFRALLALVQQPTGTAMAQAGTYQLTYEFRVAILVQQTFSILKQSPTGAIRPADLRRAAPASVRDEDVRAILAHLSQIGYLKPGRAGEWRPDKLLDELIDEQEIYSNIGEAPLVGMIVDAYSGRTLAHTGRIRLQGETLMLGGRRLEVVWRDRYRVGVRAVAQALPEAELRFQTAPFAVPLAVGQAVATHLQVAPNQLCLIQHDQGAWLFHFWGDLYGTLLAGMLQTHFAQVDPDAMVAPHNELCLHMSGTLTQLPAWNMALIQRQLHRLLPRLEPLLDLGRFYPLLPPALAHRTIVEQCDLPRFAQLYRAARVMEVTGDMRAQLLALVA